MKLYIFYFSPTGGTKHVSDIFCSVWDCEKAFVNLGDLDSDISLAGEDACVIAVPSFGGRVPQFLIPKFRHIRGNGAKAFLIAVYGNRAYEDTLAELNDTAESAGLICCGAGAVVARHSILPKYGAGRPDDSDIQELKHFSGQCKDYFHTETNGSGLTTLPGNRPYRPYATLPITPSAGKACTGCGLCAKKCPVNAIPSDNLRKCDKNACISCMQCVSLCPSHVRRVNAAILKAADLKLKKACSERKSNEFFLPRT
ncbi:hypothetical protein C818_02827 [Lachnospiraceae bacterium MD308]|nr:hypothetical protein C818_02827 [Lachnospiraceae bacterium MD308]